ncbi:MAG: hypothetical protein EBU21_16305, partial [Proteobacteria bacterium]|nr:hypothetical protein [Pseudomonadota bacterium]
MATGLGTATYTSGSGTATLTFTYTVRAADANATRLDYASQSALAGTITDSAGGAYVTANGLPQQVGYSGLYTANVYVDKVAPTVSKVTAPSRTNPPYYRTFQVPISVEFSEAVVVSGTPTLTLALCASETTPCADQVTQNAAYSSGSGTKVLVFSYKVITGVTTNGAPLQYSSTGALAGTIKDVAGNDAILTLPSLTSSASLGSTTAGNVSPSNVVIDGFYNYVDDGVPPSVTSVSSTLANGAYKAGQVVPVTITFSEEVVVGGAPTLTLDTGANSGTGTIVPYSSGSGTKVLTFNYTVAAGDNTPDLNYVNAKALTLSNENTITDLSGTRLQSFQSAGLATPTPPSFGANAYLPDPGASASLGTNKNIVIDTVAPTFAVTYSLATFTGGINGTSLTVGAVSSGALAIGQVIACPASTPNCGILPGTTIVSGAALAWQVTPSQTTIQPGTPLTTTTAMSASFTGRIDNGTAGSTGTTLTVSSVSSGT